MSDSLFKFPSAGRPNIHYVIDTSRDRTTYERLPSKVWRHAFEFDTLGDGEIQHTPEREVSADNLGDWCISFAQAVSAETFVAETSAEFRSTLIFRLPDAPRPALSAFLHSEAIYRPEPADSKKCAKTRYYNAQDLKVSATDSKRHDKRWSEITNYDDGSLRNVVNRIYRGEDGYPRTLEALEYWQGVEAARQAIGELCGDWLRFDDYAQDEKRQALREPIAVFMAAAAALRAADSLRRGVECALHNLSNRLRQAAESAA